MNLRDYSVRIAYVLIGGTFAITQTAHADTVSSAATAYCDCTKPITKKTEMALDKLKAGEEEAAAAITSEMSKELKASFECTSQIEKTFALTKEQSKLLKAAVAKKCPQPTVELK